MLEIGYWIIPTIITLLSVIPILMFKPESGDYAKFGDFPLIMIRIFISVVVSMGSWLIWALYT
jgi:hypothetical protein